MKSPWKVICAFIGIFIAGSVFGGFFALRIQQEIVTRSDEPPRVAARPPPGIQILRRLGEELDLTAAQSDKIRPLVEHAEEQIAHLRQSQFEQTNDILRKVQADVRAELTPDQRPKLDRFEENQKEVLRQAREFRQQGGPPRGGPRGPGGPDGPPPPRRQPSS